MKIICFCGKKFTDSLKMAKHRLKCKAFQKNHYYAIRAPKNIPSFKE